jgi:hypothetical protein
MLIKPLECAACTGNLNRSPQTPGSHQRYLIHRNCRQNFAAALPVVGPTVVAVLRRGRTVAAALRRHWCDFCRCYS